MTETNGIRLAEVISEVVAISSAQDALDLIATAGYQGADQMIMQARHLDPAFFDLKSGLAGEVLQKYTNYKMGLVVVGNFGDYRSESLHAFIRECNRGKQIGFVADREAALARIVG